MDGKHIHFVGCEDIADRRRVATAETGNAGMARHILEKNVLETACEIGIPIKTDVEASPRLVFSGRPMREIDSEIDALCERTK